MLRHFLNPPNWFTSASLFCGMYAIILATGVEGEPNLYRAGSMILFAAVFDTIDGGVARLTRTGSDFGIQLDSLVDAVSFGIAPAVLLYAWGIHSLGVLGLVGAFAFALCGVFRLARFNCGADGEKTPYTEGLTITMAGSTVAAAVMTHASTGRTSVENPVWVLMLALMLATLMVSNVPYRSIKSLRLRASKVVTISLSMAAILMIAVRYNFSTGFLVMLAFYASTGPLEALLFRDRLRSTGVPIKPEDPDLGD